MFNYPNIEDLFTVIEVPYCFGDWYVCFNKDKCEVVSDCKRKSNILGSNK